MGDRQGILKRGVAREAGAKVARQVALSLGMTDAGAALVRAADAATQRTALGLGSAAVSDDADYAVAPTGTPNGTKFLRDDNSWQALPMTVDPSGWSGFLNGCPATTVQGVFDWIDANK